MSDSEALECMEALLDFVVKERDEWRSMACMGHASVEQISRITDERDAAIARADHLERDNDALRRQDERRAAHLREAIARAEELCADYLTQIEHIKAERDMAVREAQTLRNAAVAADERRERAEKETINVREYWKGVYEALSGILHEVRGRADQYRSRAERAESALRCYTGITLSATEEPK
jgi:chromosome segregation ATPase